jgi:hypothetical protein
MNIAGDRMNRLGEPVHMMRNKISKNIGDTIVVQTVIRWMLESMKNLHGKRGANTAEITKTIIIIVTGGSECFINRIDNT